MQLGKRVNQIQEELNKITVESNKQQSQITQQVVFAGKAF